ncbi:MAG: DUF502 domain-containing protein [Planctomycetes bacterium]|nr:DUF502 domain-containing protein [Planctomycetota bacterium]
MLRWLKRFLLLGMAALLPTLLTLYVVIGVYRWVNTTFGKRFTLWLIGERDGDPAGNVRILRSFIPEWVPDAMVGNLLGLLLVILLALVVGRFVASYLGRTLWGWVESQINRVPLVKQLYGFFKQLIEFFTSDNKVKGRSVIAFPWPREGIYSIGLVTNDGLDDLRRRVPEEYICVFLPSSPTPFTGYTMFVRRSDTIPLNMTVDEAVQYCVSAGVILPAHQMKARRAAPPAIG